MKLSISDIKDKERLFFTVESFSDYPMLTAMENAGECLFLAPLRIHITVEKRYGHFKVHGTVSTYVGLICSRCLVDFSSDIESEFTIYYLPRVNTSLDEEVQLSKEDMVSVAFEGDEINLAPEIAEQVVMGMSSKPICSEECKGLCVSCGTDLNNGECACSQGNTNLKFSALKNFKLKDIKEK